nr:ankyrin repeat domain-containing protein [Nakamurella flavida]
MDAGVPVNLTSPAGDSLLMLAAYHVHPDTVRALLARGADTERVNDRGQTALTAAVFRNDPAVVTDLLAAGADPHGGTTTPVDTARVFGLDAMGRLLRPGS